MLGGCRAGEGTYGVRVLVPSDGGVSVDEAKVMTLPLVPAGSCAEPGFERRGNASNADIGVYTSDCSAAAARPDVSKVRSDRRLAVTVPSVLKVQSSARLAVAGRRGCL